MRHRIGALAIDVAFDLKQPWTVLFGPSGSGKSTILRAIAGLLRPHSGRVVVGGKIVSDSSTGQFVPAWARRIPLAPQNASLFPHKRVVENVTYGANELKAPQIDTEATMALFRTTQLANKLPAALSGGEAQRVNLARAAAATVEGGLLLLDEPFSGLDLRLRSEIMCDVQAWAAKRRLFVLTVTHDVAEAFQLDAEVIKLADGRIVDQGPVGSVLADERARLIGHLSPAE